MSLKILTLKVLKSASSFCLFAIFVGVGIVLHEKIIWSSGKNLNFNSPFIIFARVDFGSPWWPVATIRYLPLSFAILFSFLFIWPLNFRTSTLLVNFAMPVASAALTYFAIERPMKTIFLFIFWPNSTIELSLAIWDENVVTTTCLFFESMPSMTSLSISFAIDSDGIFLASAA